MNFYGTAAFTFTRFDLLCFDLRPDFLLLLFIYLLLLIDATWNVSVKEHDDDHTPSLPLPEVSPSVCDVFGSENHPGYHLRILSSALMLASGQAILEQ